MLLPLNRITPLGKPKWHFPANMLLAKGPGDEKTGYERVKGFASRQEVFPRVRREGNHVILDVGGGTLSPDFVPSSESLEKAPSE